MQCRFCYATFEPRLSHRERSLDEGGCVEIVERLAAAGFDKITFAGGEPTLCPWLERVVRVAKARGMTTMLVTNGTHRLEWATASDRPLDWLTLSVDSANPETNRAIGRSRNGRPVASTQLLELVGRLRDAGVRIKVNTVVTSCNVEEELTELLTAIAPERWKVLQVLPVAGQNDGSEDLLISSSAFRAFVERHRRSLPACVEVVPETNDDIRGSYAMVDPAGRFFDSASGSHHYSRPILDVGVDEAWSNVTFSADKYERRGARYEWRPLVQIRKPRWPRLVAFAGVSGAGKDTAADLLIKQGYRRVAVIDPLKHALQATLGLTHEQLWGAQRNTPISRYGCTPRQLFQLVSDPVRYLAPEFWIDRWCDRVREQLDAGHAVVCTDIRTRSELEAARALGAKLIKLVRADAGAPGTAGQHATETELASLPDSEFDTVIINDSSIAKLHARLRAALARCS